MLASGMQEHGATPHKCEAPFCPKLVLSPFWVDARRREVLRGTVRCASRTPRMVAFGSLMGPNRILIHHAIERERSELLFHHPKDRSSSCPPSRPQWAHPRTTVLERRTRSFNTRARLPPATRGLTDTGANNSSPHHPKERLQGQDTLATSQTSTQAPSLRRITTRRAQIRPPPHPSPRESPADRTRPSHHPKDRTPLRSFG